MLVIFMHTLQPVMWGVMVSSSMSLGHKPYQDYDNTEVSADISQQIIIFCTYIRYWMYYKVAIDYHHPQGVCETSTVR